MNEERTSFVIVTGASSNHFHCLQNLLYSINVYEPGTLTIVYDLGLSSVEVQRLKAKHVNYRKFDFDKYPQHVNIRTNLGEYAWKPIIVAKTLEEMGGMVLWLDAGNLIHAPLDKIRKVLATNGLYSPTSSGNIKQWTHQGTLARLGTAPRVLCKPNRNGAVVGFYSGCPGIDELAACWRNCAIDKECIAPKGSHRGNHRQDQAVLSVLIYQFQERFGYVLEDRRLDISTHNDKLPAEEVREKIGLNRMHIVDRAI